MEDSEGGSLTALDEGGALHPHTDGRLHSAYDFLWETPGVGVGWIKSAKCGWLQGTLPTTVLVSVCWVKKVAAVRKGDRAPLEIVGCRMDGWMGNLKRWHLYLSH